jgi:prolyl oligopeptidase
VRYPDAPRLDLVEDLHGRAVADPYRWLEDAADPRTASWAAAQDELAAGLLGTLPGRADFAARLTQLVHAGAVGVPVWRAGRAFSTRRDPGQEHAVLRVTEPDGTVRVLVDPMALDPAGTTTLDAWSPSWEGDRLAYQVSTGGDEESRLFVLDVATGELLDGPVDRCRYSPVAWLPGGGELFYVRRLAPGLVPAGEEQFHRRVWRHRVGADPGSDVLVHGEDSDPSTYFGARTSADGRWLVVSASIGTAPRDDVWLVDLAGGGELRALQVGVDAQTSAWVARDGRLWLHSDRNAPRSRLAVADPADPASWGPGAWRDVVPEQPDGVLADVALVDGPDGDLQVLAVHAVDATDRLSVWAADGSGRLADVTDLPPGSVAGVSAPPEGGSSAWVGYTDYATPPSVLRWNAAAPTALTSWEQAPVAGEVPAVRVVETHATSADGTPVHLFVLSATGTPDTPRPTVLYGYGGFNVSLTPAYSAQALAWVAAGGVWAVANLRGGSEHGEEWHRAGMRERKQNVFDDFAAASWSARCSPSAPTWWPPSSAAPRCWTWSGTSCSAWAAPGTTSTAPPPTRSRPAGCSATRRTTGWPRAPAIPRCCSPRSSPTRGSTRCTRASSPRRCSTRPWPRPPWSSGARSRSGTAPGRSAAPWNWPLTSSPSWPRTPACAGPTDPPTGNRGGPTRPAPCAECWTDLPESCPGGHVR